jgi:hypothetical protein
MVLMSKSVFILSFLLLLASCDPTYSHTLPSSSDNASQDQELSNNADFTDQEINSTNFFKFASLFKMDAGLTNFYPIDRFKLEEAFRIIKKVVRTKEFRDQVINFTYNGERQFVDNMGLTNEEIYQKILEGAEILRPDVNYKMDLELELYYSSGNTIGYTYPNVSKIWINRKYFDVYTYSQIAGNIFHEWTHKLGFEHEFRFSESRNASVPYAIGYMIRDLGKKFEEP